MKAIIVIPYHIPFDWQADYYTKTAEYLSSEHIVVSFLWHDALSFREYIERKKPIFLFKKHRRNWFVYQPVHMIPFRRFYAVEYLNFFLNAIIFSLFIFILGIRYRIKKHILWLFSPKFFPLIEFFGKKYISVYDCVDYLYAKDKQDEAHLLLQERKTIRACTVVTANSRVLYEHIKKERNDVYLVPQGFSLKIVKNTVFFKKDRGQRKPIIGYIGTIDYRLDYRLLDTLIRATPFWDYWFCGPVEEKNSAFKNLLSSYKNVFWIGKKRKEEVFNVINQFDIGIIPYDISLDFARYCYPMKLFEYFYMGKPIVATPIEELKRFPKYVKIGWTTEEWEKHIQTLLRKSWQKAYQKEEQKLAIANSWERKIKMIMFYVSMYEKKKYSYC